MWKVPILRARSQLYGETNLGSLPLRCLRRKQFYRTRGTIHLGQQNVRAFWGPRRHLGLQRITGWCLTH